MTPVEPNPDVVIRRLRMMRDALDTLDGFRGVDVAQLNDDPVARAAVERLLQVIVGLAFDINAHLVAKTLGRSPETGRASFHDLVEAGVLDEALAATLAPSANKSRTTAPPSAPVPPVTTKTFPVAMCPSSSPAVPHVSIVDERVAASSDTVPVVLTLFLWDKPEVSILLAGFIRRIP